MTSSSVPAATSGVAWIAGVGASAGLGAALARRYARGGLLVAVSARTRTRLDTIVHEVRDAGGHAMAVGGDVGDESDVQRMLAEVTALGPLHAAVFNAGTSVRGSALELEASQFEQTWRGTTLAGFLFGRAALRTMLANGADPATPRGRGSLIFTGATASVRGGARFAAFAAAKAGLRSLAQSLARDAGPQGVHVAHVVIDGGIDGERLRNSMPQRALDAGADGLLDPDAIAEAYWQLHVQHRSAWTQEIDLRPYKEPF